MDTVLSDRLTRFIEKMVLDGTPDQAQKAIDKQIASGKAEEVRAALKAVTHETVKPIAEGWLTTIKDLQATVDTPEKPVPQSRKTQTAEAPRVKPTPPAPAPQAKTQTAEAPQAKTKPASPSTDNDDLSWLIAADKAPRRFQPQAAGAAMMTAPRSRTSEVPPVSSPRATTEAPSASSQPRTETPMPSPQPTTETSTPAPSPVSTATLNAVQDRLKNAVSPDMLAFLKQYAPGVAWLVVGLIGIFIMVTSFVFAGGNGLYPLYAIFYYPLSIYRHVSLNAFVRFNTQFFWSRSYVGQSYNTVYYQDRPNGILNWIVNIALTILVMFYLYAFREAWVQGRFLYTAYQAWKTGSTLPTRSAQWGRGWKR